jgi:hypothetical protein
MLFETIDDRTDTIVPTVGSAWWLVMIKLSEGEKVNQIE